jgi:hypothetical protein
MMNVTLRVTFIAAVLFAASPPSFAQTAIVPDPSLTPGAVRTTNIGEICGTSTSTLRHWSREDDNRILAEYGLEVGSHPTLEIDHSIPLCLGGSDDDRNKWPQPRRSIEPVFNAEMKDRLEAKLCSLVCTGEIDIPTAQKEISEDWISAYGKYMGRGN